MIPHRVRAHDSHYTLTPTHDDTSRPDQRGVLIMSGTRQNFAGPAAALTRKAGSQVTLTAAPRPAQGSPFLTQGRHHLQDNLARQPNQLAGRST